MPYLKHTLHNLTSQPPRCAVAKYFILLLVSYFVSCVRQGLNTWPMTLCAWTLTIRWNFRSNTPGCWAGERADGGATVGGPAIPEDAGGLDQASWLCSLFLWSSRDGRSRYGFPIYRRPHPTPASAHLWLNRSEWIVANVSVRFSQKHILRSFFSIETSNTHSLNFGIILYAQILSRAFLQNRSTAVCMRGYLSVLLF